MMAQNMKTHHVKLNKPTYNGTKHALLNIIYNNIKANKGTYTNDATYVDKRKITLT